MMTELFVSPHLDDAVFSCAGAIQRAVAAGNRTMVVTLFSHGGREHATRRAEDRTATALLGAEPRWLGLPDAPWRNRHYRSFREIILETAPGDSHAPALSALASLVQSGDAFIIYAPLAVGTHIDHRLAFAAAGELGRPDRVRYYEDRPYAFATGAVELRLRDIGFRFGPFDPASFLRSLRRLPHVRRYLPPGPERRRCEAMLLSPSGNAGCNLALAHSFALTHRETRRAHEAAAAYHSQWPEFAGNRSAWARRDRLHARTLGYQAPRAERYWMLPSTNL